MRAFIRFFAARTTLANVITLMILFLGISSLTIIQRDNFPSVDFDEMTITTRYPGASPEDVELNVTNAIEEELKEVDGLDKVNSFSMENISIIHLKLDPDAQDKKKIKTDVRDAVSRVADLPAEIDENPLVKEITTSTAIPIIEVGITGKVPYKTLREIARRAEKELLNVPGVASLNKYGYLDREIKVEVSQDALEGFQIPTHEIVAAIRNRNIRATGGSFESYTNEKNIVTLAQFTDPLEVSEVIVRSSTEEAIVRISDLAILKDDFEPAKVLSHMNGTPAISFLIFKKESADIIRTVDAIKALVEKNHHRLPQGVNIEYSNDKSRIVRTRLQVVITNGVVGLALVMLVLTTFLNLRSAFWVAMGIPVALLGTLFLLPLFGAYLDSIALAAMILVIGIIVDDGIVITENIWRYQENGLPPLEAAVEGAYSVYKPVLTTIITTALAFAPMFFMTGTLGSFVYVIPLVVLLALIISLAEITFVLPAHLIAGSKEITSSARKATTRFLRLQKGFGHLLKHALGLRYGVLAAFFLLLSITFWYAAKYMDFVLFPTRSADELYLTVELPSGSSLEYTAQKVNEIEEIIMTLPEDELDSFVTRVGSHGDFNLGENENWALLGVYLTPYSVRERNADQIVEQFRTQTADIEGIDNINFIIDSGGPPVGRPITLRIVGSDDDLRHRLAAQVVQTLNQMPGVKDIDRNDKRGKDQIKIDLDYIRLANLGLNVADIAKAVRLAYDGEIVTSVRYGDEDVEFRVILEQEARRSVDTLRQLIIPNSEGRFVQLLEVAEFNTAPGISNVIHYDNERAITITADIIKGETTPIKATNSVLSGLDLDRDWAGMRVIVGGEAEETAESMVSLGVAFLSAAVGIYLVLLLLFNSLTQPILVMLAIPFGLIGVIAAFALHQQALGFLAMLGVVGLTGIVVNDSLILVNLVNRLKAEESGRTLLEIIVQATEHRLRPILLTSITTVAGLLPMAYGLGGDDPFSAPMALAMGYGILFATPLTLILLPCMLAIQHDIAGIFSRLGRMIGP
ncbi:MAG: efflux RND transporter permease subunit [Gammaproteobacteria bacterium]|nr:efflux RND transporter permease subunit [Gammaproteobacteria bacterium]